MAERGEGEQDRVFLARCARLKTGMAGRKRHRFSAFWLREISLVYFYYWFAGLEIFTLGSRILLYVSFFIFSCFSVRVFLYFLGGFVWVGLFPSRGPIGGNLRGGSFSFLVVVCVVGGRCTTDPQHPGSLGLGIRVTVGRGGLPSMLCVVFDTLFIWTLICDLCTLLLDLWTLIFELLFILFSGFFYNEDSLRKSHCRY